MYLSNQFFDICTDVYQLTDLKSGRHFYIPITATSTLTFEPSTFSDKERVWSAGEISIECSNVNINWEAFNEMFVNVNSKEINDRNVSMTFQFPDKIPCRWHKKRRINKKWTKRYGQRYTRGAMKTATGRITEMIPEDCCYSYRVEDFEIK